MPDQDLWRDFHPKAIDLIHVIVDSRIDTPTRRGREPIRSSDAVIAPEAIADIS